MLSFTVAYERCIKYMFIHINISCILGQSNGRLKSPFKVELLNSEVKVNEGSQSIHSPPITVLSVFILVD